jgi:diacylglycerol kinase family enzyme/membrane-associated phospholipid phosphatase
MHASANQTGSGDYTVEALAAALRQRGLDADVIEVGPDDRVSDVAKRAALGGAQAVVAIGGDGMVHEVARGLWSATHDGARTVFGIVPAGTMNNIAATLGIPEELDAALDSLATALRFQRYRPLDLARIGDMTFVEEAGLGLLSQLMRIGESVKQNELAVPVAAAQVGQALTTYQSAPLRVTVDGRRRHVHALHVVVCNAPVIAMRMNVAPLARMDDGLLDVVIYERYQPLQLLASLAARIGGRVIADARIRPSRSGAVANARVRRYRARRIIVEPAGNAAGTSWPVEVDGDLAGDCGPDKRWRRVEISVLPHALRLAALPAAATIEERPWRTTLRAISSTLKRSPAPTPTPPAPKPMGAAKMPGGAPEAVVRNTVGQVAEPPRRAARGAALIRTLYLVGGALAVALGFAARRSGLLPGDLHITRALQATRTPGRDRFWRAVAWAGFPGPTALVVSALTALLWLARFRLEALFLLLATGVNGVNYTLKRVVRRQRPTEPHVRVHRLIHEPSFPSGHVMFYVSAFGFLVAAALANLRPSALRRAIVGLGGSLIALVGASRVYLGAHWPSDVVAGYLYGGLYLGGALELYAWAKDHQARSARLAPNPALGASANEVARVADDDAPATSGASSRS